MSSIIIKITRFQLGIIKWLYIPKRMRKTAKEEGSSGRIMSLTKLSHELKSSKSNPNRRFILVIFTFATSSCLMLVFSFAIITGSLTDLYVLRRNDALSFYSIIIIIVFYTVYKRLEFIFYCLRIDFCYLL